VDWLGGIGVEDAGTVAGGGVRFHDLCQPLGR
jgi:hypothetical protein